VNPRGVYKQPEQWLVRQRVFEALVLAGRRGELDQLARAAAQWLARGL
jgi:hypothetical protein